MPARFVTVIACGGLGSRAGGDKTGFDLAGRRLVDWVIDTAHGFGTPVALAVRDETQLADAGLPLLVDEAPDRGPVSALLSGFRFAAVRESGWILMLAGDQPFLPGDLAERLSAAIGGHGVAIPVSDGRDQNMAALWRANLPALERYVASGGRSLWGFAEQVGLVRVPWDDGSGDRFADIDDRDQLAAAEARIASEGRGARA